VIGRSDDAPDREEYRSIFDASSDGLVVNDLETGVVMEANPAFCRMHGYSRDELLGAHPWILIHASSQPLFLEYMATVRDGGTFRRRAVDVRKDGSLLDVEVIGRVFQFQGRAAVLGVVRDVSDQVRTQRTLAEREAQYRAIFEATSDGMAVVEQDTGAVLEVNPAFCEMHGYRREELVGETALKLIDPTDHALFEQFLVSVKAGRTFRARARDVRGDSSKFPIDVVGRTFSYQGKDQVLAVVRDITAQVRTEAVLEERVAERTRELAEALEEMDRLYHQAQRAAALEERQRLARELHDSVSQALYGISLGARTALDRLRHENPEGLKEALGYVLELADAALSEMRALIFELRPESLEKEGLRVALERHIASARARHGLEVDASLESEPRLSLAAKEVAYRVAQEALQNVVKHAQATRVAIELHCDNTSADLVVEDNGAGFDPTQSFAGHLGLRSMRERAETVAGELTISSRIGGGTRVSLRLPVEFPALAT
jgi:PAS domain S-box-containing protein